MICFFIKGGSSFFSLLTRIWRDELENQKNINYKKNLIKKELLNGNKDSKSDSRFGSKSGSGSGSRVGVLIFRWPLGGFLHWGTIIKNKYKIYNTF
jgi:hypothetical protein